MTDDEKALDYWTAELQARLRQKPLEEWTDMEIVKAFLYEYAVETPGGETFSMEALLRVEAELERLRAYIEEKEGKEGMNRWPHWIPMQKYYRTMEENERLREENERLREEHA